MSTLNHIPVGQRIDQRFRQRARGGRAWFAMAKQILIPDKSVENLGGGGQNRLTTAAAGGCQTNSLGQATGSPSSLQSFELTSADHAIEYLNALFDAAVKRGLEPLIERRKDQTVFRLICSSVDWASVRQTALMK